MALTSREKQAAWRARQAANAARLAELEQAIADTTERMETFLANAGALLFGIDADAGNPAAVRMRAKLLQCQVDALVLGEELPKLSAADQRRADLLSQHATAPTPADEQEIRRQLSSIGPG
jgi:hypothetical protein